MTADELAKLIPDKVARPIALALAIAAGVCIYAEDFEEQVTGWLPKARAALASGLAGWEGMEEYHWSKCRDCEERGHHLILPLTAQETPDGE